MIWISEGLDYDASNLQGDPYADSVLTELGRILHDAARANVAIYAVSPVGLAATGEDAIELASGNASVASAGTNRSIFAPGSAVSLDDPSLGSSSFLSDHANAAASLRGLAALTGGFSVAHRNDVEEGLGRIIEDTSRYYFLGFTPSEEGVSGELKTIQVRVQRQGVRVRSRRGYVVSEESERAANAAEDDLREANMDDVDEIGKVIAQPVPVTELRLRAVAAPMGQEGETALVPIAVWCDARSFNFEGGDGRFRDDVRLWIAALDARGDLVENRTGRVHIEVPLTEMEQLKRDGFRFASVLRLLPGSYQVRIAVRESGGNRTGSLFFDLKIPKPEDGLLRGLALSSRHAASIPVARLGNDQALPTPLTTARSFEETDELITYLELANPEKKDFNLIVDLRATDGRPLTRFETKVPDSGGKSVVVLSRRITLADLAPDEYQLTFQVIHLDGRELASRRAVFSVP